MGKNAEPKPAPKATVKKEKANVDQKDQANFGNSLKKSNSEEAQQVLQLYQSLPRFSQQKKDLIQAWKADKTCKWISTWNKSLETEKKETVNERAGFGTRFQVAAMLEMTADSDEFLAVEKHLAKQKDMVDFNWDETNPLEASYKASKLQRWNLGLLKSTWSAVSQSQAAKDNLTMSSSGSEVLQISGQALDDKGVSKPLKEFQNVCNSLNSCKNAWEKELAKAQDLACRLEIKGDPSFHAKGKGLQTWCQEQLKAIANLRSYVAASEDLAPEDTSPESLSKSLPAAKAWLASSQEKLQEAKAKVKTHQALL